MLSRWPVGGGKAIRAWIHQPTRKFRCSRKILENNSNNPSLSLPSFNPTLFPSFQNTADPLPSSVEKYGLDTEDPILKTYAFQLKWETLLDSLSRDRASPNRVWEAYCDVGSLVGFEKLPLQIHQETLRKAVPPKERLGSIIAKRLQAARKPSVPHLYESRLQAIIRNIRDSGYRPALDDYHFILSQFAAVAYPDGCRAVFRELVHRQKHQPTYKTYGLCLQAIAHRLTLPCPYRYRKDLLSYSSRMCFELLEDMWDRGISLTSVNFDLTHRIFKATQNWTIYEYLLKVAYGIDLANPDRLALEVQNHDHLSSSTLQISSPLSVAVDTSNSSQQKPLKPIPFNIAALNTLIDALGTRGEISRMVIAFEVLTNPLPKVSSSDVQWPDDDEDESAAFYQFNNNSSNPSDDAGLSYEYPSTAPNTTTFTFMIRHMAKAKEDVFARHYLTLAVEMDRAENSRLRNELVSKPLDRIVAPRLAVTRAMVLPLHGLGNRMRHRPTLRWAYWMTRQAIRDKQQNLDFYKKWRDKHRPLESSDEVSLREESPELPSQGDASSALSLPQEFNPPAVSTRTFAVPQILQIDFDNPAVPTTGREEGAPSKGNYEFIKKAFQIDLHITLLERDIQELQELCDRTRQALKRSTHRLKEKLGRRVWNSKDIFLMSKDQRVHVDRREWMQTVGFGTSGVGKGTLKKTTRDLPRWMEDDDEDGETGERNTVG